VLARSKVRTYTNRPRELAAVESAYYSDSISGGSQENSLNFRLISRPLYVDFSGGMTTVLRRICCDLGDAALNEMGRNYHSGPYCNASSDPARLPLVKGKP
jgi:hypothetical protein